MRGLIAFVGLAIVTVGGVYTYQGPKECCAPSVVAATKSTAKQYQATITRKDGRNNTKTFTDYCTATSNSAATTVFKERYPGATVSGVRESK